MDILIGIEETISKFNPAIIFDCEVACETLKATVIGAIDHPLYYGFRVQFSDGHIDDFTFVENNLECESELKHYAEAIRNDLTVVCALSPGVDVYTMRFPIENEQTNIWVLQDHDDDEKYDVYYNGDYRFHMIKKGLDWDAKTCRQINPDIINNDLAKEVGNMLYYYRGE